MFRALPKVFDAIPNAKLCFIGKDPREKNGNKASENLLAALPGRYNSRIEIVGIVKHEEIAGFFQRANLAVFPSIAEAHPIAVIESMACGTPTIFMRHGPGPEVISHDRDGVLCDSFDPASIAGALIELLSNRRKAKLIGENASARAAKQFDLKRFVDSNEKFYRECIAS